MELSTFSVYTRSASMARWWLLNHRLAGTGPSRSGRRSRAPAGLERVRRTRCARNCRGCRAASGRALPGSGGMNGAQLASSNTNIQKVHKPRDVPTAAVAEEGSFLLEFVSAWLGADYGHSFQGAANTPSPQCRPIPASTGPFTSLLNTTRTW